MVESFENVIVNVIVSHVAKKCHTFYGTWTFVAMSSKACLLPLCLSLNNPVYYSHPVSWRSMLILSCHPWLGLPGGLFSSGFPTKTLYACVIYQLLACAPPHLILLDYKRVEIFCYVIADSRFDMPSRSFR